MQTKEGIIELVNLKDNFDERIGGSTAIIVTIYND